MIALHGFNVTLWRLLRQALDTVPYAGLCGPVQALQRLHGGLCVSDFQRDQLLPCPGPLAWGFLFAGFGGQRGLLNFKQPRLLLHSGEQSPKF